MYEEKDRNVNSSCLQVMGFGPLLFSSLYLPVFLHSLQQKMPFMGGKETINKTKIPAKTVKTGISTRYISTCKVIITVPTEEVQTPLGRREGTPWVTRAHRSLHGNRHWEVIPQRLCPQHTCKGSISQVVYHHPSQGLSNTFMSIISLGYSQPPGGTIIAFYK